MDFSKLTRDRVGLLAKATFDAWMDDAALRLSAALAYYSIFSIAPLLIIAIGVAGLVLGGEAVRGQVEEQLKAYVGTKAAESVQSMVQSASKPSDSWLGAAVGFVTLMIGASGVFGQLKDALNTVWEVKAKPKSGIWNFVRERLLSFGMVLVIGFLLLVSLMITTAFAGITRYLQVMPLIGGVLAFIFSVAVATILFALIFKVLPDAQVEWRSVWIGATVTGLLFELGKFGLSFYLGRESTASSFGAAGSVILLLLWVYYASCILLFGAEFTRVYARESGHCIQPSANAVAVTPEDRAQEGLQPEPRREHLPRPIPSRVELVPPAASMPERHPLGVLLATTAISFLVSLALRRHAERRQEPEVNIREGFAGLKDQAVEKITELLWEIRTKAGRRIG